MMAFRDPKARYFLLHAVCNLATVVLSFDDVMRFFANPLDAYVLPTRFYGLVVGLCLHAYHCLFFKMSSDDVFHHSVFALFGGCYTYAFQPYIVTSVPLMSMNGIPGMIDYTLLAGVRLGYVRKETEKELNATINTWFRCPYGVLVVGIGIPSLMQQRRWECVPCMLVALYNSIYYGRQAVENMMQYRLKNSPGHTASS